jgi:tetrahydromethanopterin:alpha-L-glutamate ligase
VNRVAIMTDERGWHGAQLRRAFKARGVEAKYVSLTQCGFDLQQAWHGLAIAGFDRALPDAAMVRSIPGGTFEQVTLRLSILHALRELGVPVYNDARAIERSVDKAMTSFLLHRAGVSTPGTWVTQSRARARTILLRETARGRELVLKPLFGSQGEGLLRLAAGMDVPALESYNQVCYLQRFVDSREPGWCDWRVLVVGGRARAAMLRRGASWINNVARGARCERAELDDELANLASAAAQAIGMDYAGVDIIRDRDGAACVIEVNSIPAWKGLQSVCTDNIAQLLVDDLLDRKLPAQPRAAGNAA